MCMRVLKKKPIITDLELSLFFLERKLRAREIKTRSNCKLETEQELEPTPCSPLSSIANPPSGH